MKTADQQYRYILWYAYALTALVAIAAITLFVSFLVRHNTDQAARDRVASYYLASAATVEAMHSDAHELLHMSGYATNPATAAVLYSMRLNVARLRELHQQYREQRFEATLQRLVERFEAVESSVAAGAAPADLLLRVEALELSIDQLYRLHLIAAGDTLAGIRELARRNLPNLAILTIILTGTILVGWYLTRVLKQSLLRREKAEQALALSHERMHHLQKLEALGQLVGGVAHDFNNLLTAIHGQAELLSHEASADAQDAANEITRAAQQASALTSQLLAFSRRQPIEPRDIDLNRLIADLEPLLRRLIGENIELDFDYGEQCGTVELDPAQLRQVVINLFINARDAMPEGGTISLSTGVVEVDDHDDDGLPAGAYMRLAVADTGIGMDKETRDRVFEPYFTTKPMGRGTGLGLAMAHGMVTAAGGRITVQSDIGHGSRFEVCLPASERPAATPVADAAPLRRGSETVLVVEDEEQIRTFLRAGLSSLGYSVLTAAGGAEGLEICRESGHIDVIVSDVIMPDMNGPQFMTEALPLQRGAVAIFMTGYADDALTQQRVSGQRIPLLHKPFRLEAMARLIREQLDARSERADPTAA